MIRPELLISVNFLAEPCYAMSTFELMLPLKFYLFKSPIPQIFKWRHSQRVENTTVEQILNISPQRWSANLLNCQQHHVTLLFRIFVGLGVNKSLASLRRPTWQLLTRVRSEVRRDNLCASLEPGVVNSLRTNNGRWEPAEWNISLLWRCYIPSNYGRILCCSIWWISIVISSNRWTLHSNDLELS